MAPNRVVKRKSTTSTSSTSPGRQTSRRGRPSKDKQTTPDHSLNKPGYTLTHSQKQALIDNLQLEITERARKLRAQYALQAQALRTRLEIRIHRIPAALRKTTIGELLQRHTQASAGAVEPKSAAPISKKTIASPLKLPKSPAKIPQAVSKATQPSVQPRGTKRKSDDIDADKENASSEHTSDNPPKRTRTGAPVPSKETRNLSKRVVHPSQVLSPKSSNTRAIPQSPFKSGLPSPIKSNLARPVSPLKPSVAAPTAAHLAKTAEKPAAKTRTAPSATRAASKTTTATATRAKRAVPAPAPPRIVSAADQVDDTRTSNVSEADSNSTTVVRQVKKAPAAAKTVKKTGAVARAVNAVNKKAAAAKAEITGGSVAGGRTLRKRA